MTDEELIARLRDYGHVGTVLQAADRIEALVRERDAAMMTGHDLAKMEYRELINDLEARAERLEAAASAVADDVCEYICPSIGLAGRPIPHDPRCIALRAALNTEDSHD